MFLDYGIPAAPAPSLPVYNAVGCHEEQPPPFANCHRGTFTIIFHTICGFLPTNVVPHHSGSGSGKRGSKRRQLKQTQHRHDTGQTRRQSKAPHAQTQRRRRRQRRRLLKAAEGGRLKSGTATAAAATSSPATAAENKSSGYSRYARVPHTCTQKHRHTYAYWLTYT